MQIARTIVCPVFMAFCVVAMFHSPAAWLDSPGF